MDNYNRVILLGVESVFGGYDRRWEADLDYERKLIIFPRATFFLDYNSSTSYTTPSTKTNSLHNQT